MSRKICITACRPRLQRKIITPGFTGIGVPGPRGAQGIQGPPGTAPPSIIPFSSGFPNLVLNIGSVNVLGHGSRGVSLGGSPSVQTLENQFAYSNPRSGTVISFSASVFIAATTTTSSIIFIDLVQLPPNSATPTTIATLRISVPAGTPANTVLSGSTTLSSPIVLGDRLVVTATGTSFDPVFGAVNAGVAIA